MKHLTRPALTLAAVLACHSRSALAGKADVIDAKGQQGRLTAPTASR